MVVGVVRNGLREEGDDDDDEEEEMEEEEEKEEEEEEEDCLLYTSPSPRDLSTSRMPSSA